MTRRLRVYSIPLGRPFVDALAAGLLSGALGNDPADPLSFGAATVFLPTRRSGRALIEAFLRRSGGRPLILPRIVPLGDVEEDALDLTGEREAGEWEGAGEIPPAIPPLRRDLLLSKLIVDWHRKRRKTPPPPEQGLLFAAELARLIDQVHTEGLSFDRLADLVPEDLAEHWQITLDFLHIVVDQWPEILAREGCVDPAHRRNLLLDAQARAWQLRPPPDLVIAAGSTGSIPATARLLSVIAALPNGGVVLPGLDVLLDEQSWLALDDTHPQFNLARLLARLDIQREDVEDWPAPGVPESAPARARLMSDAMRPAQTSDAWAALHTDPAAISGVARIDCPTPREEAGVIALLMRESLETEHKRAALITPDRDLARRVRAELSRYGIEVDDSGGVPLAQTPPAVFLRLLADMTAEKCAPVPFLAALKHPLAAGGVDPGTFRALAREFENAVLRGPRPAPGFAGLRAALRECDACDGKSKKRLKSWLDGIDESAKAFVKLMARKQAPLRDLLAAHIAFAETMAASDSDSGGARLWAGDAGEAMADLLAELMEAAAGVSQNLGPISGADYPAMLETAMMGRVVRPKFGRHPRLYIWGLLEARLQHVDRLILSSLNEGTWPLVPPVDPWMSRPMRVKFGLPPPERRIGLAAHDFAEGFCAPEVFLTRSARVEGQPTVPSRWLLRLDAALAPDRQIPRATRYLDWLEKLGEPKRITPVPAPAPKPPLAFRPRKFSVTEIETLIRDPYAVFAKKILRLKPLDPLDADPGAAERGSFIHDILDRFIRQNPELPDDSHARLIALGEQIFGDALARPGIRAFWWPRFLRVAEWFLGSERQRRSEGVAVLATETKGKLEISVDGGSVTLTAKADRIDRVPGGLAILDYKTGTVPSAKQVKAGLAPQLPLEAAIAAAGKFDEVMPGPVMKLVYVHLTGRDPPGDMTALDAEALEMTPDLFAAKTLADLSRLLGRYADPGMPYRSRPRPIFARKMGDYDHLARVKEWSAGLGDDS